MTAYQTSHAAMGRVFVGTLQLVNIKTGEEFPIDGDHLTLTKGNTP